MTARVKLPERGGVCVACGKERDDGDGGAIVMRVTAKRRGEYSEEDIRYPLCSRCVNTASRQLRSGWQKKRERGQPLALPVTAKRSPEARMTEYRTGHSVMNVISKAWR